MIDSFLCVGEGARRQVLRPSHVVDVQARQQESWHSDLETTDVQNALKCMTKTGKDMEEETVLYRIIADGRESCPCTWEHIKVLQLWKYWAGKPFWICVMNKNAAAGPARDFRARVLFPVLLHLFITCRNAKTTKICGQSSQHMLSHVYTWHQLRCFQRQEALSSLVSPLTPCQQWLKQNLSSYLPCCARHQRWSEAYIVCLKGCICEGSIQEKAE